MKNIQDKNSLQYQPYYKGTLHITNNNTSNANKVYLNNSRNKIN